MSRQDVKDEVIHLRSAGVDLGKRFLLACTRTPSPKRPGSWSLETERFGTTQAEIRRLLAWLVEAHVEVVVMEATSDYWRSVYHMLQPHLNLMLVNPAHLKGIKGRRTDPNDAAFLARADGRPGGVREEAESDTRAPGSIVAAVATNRGPLIDPHRHPVRRTHRHRRPIG